jgi:hypothetical protein
MKPETTGEELTVCGYAEKLEFIENQWVVLRQADSDGVARMSLWVLKGYSWDGASIPRYLWWLFGHRLAPEFRLASLWHDRLCELAECVEDRTIADAIFLRLLREAGVSHWRRLLMWAAVRLYGIFIWRIRRGKTTTQHGTI